MGLSCNTNARGKLILFVYGKFDASFLTPVIPTSKQMRHIVPDHPALISGASCRPFGTRAETPWLRRALFPIFAAALVNLVGCTTQSGSISLQGKPLSGYVRMTQVQAAYLGSGSAGNGVLRYKGSSYPFSVGGLGVGGIGISKIEAKGEVYGLQRLRDFPAHMFRPDMASQSATRARATCGCRTEMV
jgi:hypothetical protein